MNGHKRAVARKVSERLRQGGRPMLLAQFMATENIQVDNFGRAKMHIHPPLIADGIYKNVTAPPADGALIKHPSSPNATPQVDGAGQTGSEIWTKGWKDGDTLYTGDMFVTIAGVFAKPPIGATRKP